MRNTHLDNDTSTAALIGAIYTAIQENPGIDMPDLLLKTRFPLSANQSYASSVLSMLLLADNTPIQGEKIGGRWRNLRCVRPLPAVLKRRAEVRRSQPAPPPRRGPR